jgi:hypothetical protein
MSKKIISSGPPKKKMQPKKLNADIVNSNNEISDYKINLIQNQSRNKPKIPVSLATFGKIKSTIKPSKDPQNKHNFQKHGTWYKQSNFQKKPNQSKMYIEEDKYSNQMSSRNEKTRSILENDIYHQPNPIFLRRPKSKTYGGLSPKNKPESRHSNISINTINTQKSSYLSGRRRSPMNNMGSLETKILDTSVASPRRIRLPNSSRANILFGKNAKKSQKMLGKVKFYQINPHKKRANAIHENLEMDPNKIKFFGKNEEKDMRESENRITNRIINELVKENQMVEEEFRKKAKQENEYKKSRGMQIPDLDVSLWEKIDEVNINNINSFGLDRHERFPTGHKFSLQNHVPNDTGEKNWFISKYNKFFGKEQYKNTEFQIPKELKNYEKSYEIVRPEDLKKLLVKEQIRDRFDHYLLKALMSWTPEKIVRKNLGSSFDQMETSRIFGKGYQPTRRRNQTKIKSVYWEQRREEGRGMDYSSLRELQVKMKEANETYNIIKNAHVKSRFIKRNQEINFSREEIRKIFRDSNHDRMAFFFRKYRGILYKEDINDNVLFIENQMHGIEDQLNTMMVEHRVKYQGREQLFRTDTERYTKRAAVLGKKIMLMRETLRVSKKVGWIMFWGMFITGRH